MGIYNKAKPYEQCLCFNVYVVKIKYVFQLLLYVRAKTKTRCLDNWRNLKHMQQHSSLTLKPSTKFGYFFKWVRPTEKEKTLYTAFNCVCPNLFPKHCLTFKPTSISPENNYLQLSRTVNEWSGWFPVIFPINVWNISGIWPPFGQKVDVNFSKTIYIFTLLLLDSVF